MPIILPPARRISLPAAFLLLGFSSGLGAQQPSVAPDTLRVDSLAADGAAQNLDTVRIAAKPPRSRYTPAYMRSATKTPALARDVPQSITTVTRELMRDQGMQSMADVVRYVPGVTMGQGEGNRDQPTIRGNSSTADFHVDGVRDDAQYFRDVYNLDRVEALKGANAMAFGRGGGGGVLNRVTKEAAWDTQRDVTVEGGSHDKRRVTGDFQHSLSRIVATRINGLYEKSGVFRDGAFLDRFGFNPTLTVASPSRRTRAIVGYERFRDYRTADRGIPSFRGAPLETSPSTFFGNPGASSSSANVSSGTATLSHDEGSFQVRNHTRLARYRKGYQNVFPGAVDATGTQVSISAYRQELHRTNSFNQTDLNWSVHTGPVGHDILIGAELGVQGTDNLRETGFFSGTSAVVNVPVENPLADAPLTFRQTASDADSRTDVRTRSVYIQDQISILPGLRIIGGARYERFDLRFRDERSPARLRRTDAMISPRAGLVLKPAETMSLYGSYGVSFLPGAGDQFASLTEATRALEPERFTNYELGAKWDAMNRLGIAAAIYRLDRTNTRAVSPLDATKFVQTGEQRSEGFELSVNGSATAAWDVAVSFARQDASITSATTAAPEGATVPLVPRTTLSIWNRYSISSQLGFAIGGIHQSEVFAGIDNKVTLPSFVRYDAAMYASIRYGLRAQLNVENVLNTRYYPTAHSNNNITPGSPRAARVSLSAAF